MSWPWNHIKHNSSENERHTTTHPIKKSPLIEHRHFFQQQQQKPFAIYMKMHWYEYVTDHESQQTIIFRVAFGMVSVWTRTIVICFISFSGGLLTIPQKCIRNHVIVDVFLTAVLSCISASFRGHMLYVVARLCRQLFVTMARECIFYKNNHREMQTIANISHCCAFEAIQSTANTHIDWPMQMIFANFHRPGRIFDFFSVANIIISCWYSHLKNMHHTQTQTPAEKRRHA